MYPSSRFAADIAAEAKPGKARAAMRKRYSILVREIGSGREIELCQVDSNPRTTMSTTFCSSSTELQLLLPFVRYCGRFPGICPLTDRSSIADIYCYRCRCIAPGSFSAR
jgi:hypothetical protein